MPATMSSTTPDRISFQTDRLLTDDRTTETLGFVRPVGDGWTCWMLNAANDAAKEHRCYFQRAGWGRGMKSLRKTRNMNAK